MGMPAANVDVSAWHDAQGRFIGNVYDRILLFGHDEDFVPWRQSTPTDARPGSPEKIEVLRQRVLRGEPLFHPRDAQVLAHVNTCYDAFRSPLMRVSATRTRDARR